MSAKIKVVNLVGNVNLSALESLAEEIRASLAERETVLLSLSQAADIDLGGIQLLYAARRYAEKQGKSLHITGSIPETVARRLHRGGFTEDLLLDGRELDERMHGFNEGKAPDA